MSQLAAYSPCPPSPHASQTPDEEQNFTVGDTVLRKDLHALASSGTTPSFYIASSEELFTVGSLPEDVKAAPAGSMIKQDWKVLVEPLGAGKTCSWYYGWVSSRSDRLLSHVMRIYAFYPQGKGGGADYMRCIGVLDSPAWRIISQRRSKQRKKTNELAKSAAGKQRAGSHARQSSVVSGLDDGPARKVCLCLCLCLCIGLSFVLGRAVSSCPVRLLTQLFLQRAKFMYQTSYGRPGVAGADALLLAGLNNNGTAGGAGAGLSYGSAMPGMLTMHGLGQQSFSNSSSSPTNHTTQQSEAFTASFVAMFMDHPTLKAHFNDAMNKIMTALSQPSLDRGEFV